MTDATPSPEPEVVRLDPQPALSRRFRAAPAEIGNKLGEVLPALCEQARQQGLELAGAPYTLYHEHDMAAGEFELEAGVPTAAPGRAEGETLAAGLPGGPAAKLVHLGPYEKLGETHSRLHQWLGESGRKPAGPPWERYVTDPSQEPDPSRWRTEVYVPLSE